KRKLRRTWATFFGMHGRLFPVQVKVIPVVLAGKNAVVASPTASGKTEAVVAPLTERCLGEGWEGLSILYISPTRALAKDIHHRLKDQLSELDISLLVRIGDRPLFNPNVPPEFLITTPESLDSLICRYNSNFEDVKAVVLDEIHFLDNTYRGDQLRILLRRLKRIAKTDFNVYALSATIANPEDVGARYLENNFEVIVLPGKREIEYTLVRSVKDVFDHARGENLRKILIFCNSRAATEDVAEKCKKLWGNYAVCVHHGSLSRQAREEAETFMREAQDGVCVATMTIEVGIDIGDIDAVVLAEVPWSISSLLQRIGRGNRREQRCRVFAIYSSEEEKLMFEWMLDAASEGYIEPVDYSPDLSVVVQQIFSSLYACPSGLETSYFIEIFNGICPEDILKDVLMHLAGRGYVEWRHGKWYASTKLMDLGERGEIHSNIPSIKALKVIDVTSRRVIGEVQYPVDEIFLLGGRTWKITDITHNKIYVKPVKSKAPPAKFRRYSSKGRFHHLLPPYLQS
nr:DEAD/DEAH box helicase [Candidatus Freyrarchaeum guaymaensis]